MHQVVFMKQVKIVDAPFLQVQFSIQFYQCLPAVGLKIPEGVIEVKEKVPVFDFCFQAAAFRFVRSEDNLQTKTARYECCDHRRFERYRQSDS